MIGQRRGQCKGNDDQPDELFGKQNDEIGDGCAENFSNADFLGALFGGIGRQAEQTQARNKNGENCKKSGERAHRALVAIHAFKLFVLKRKLKRTVRIEFLGCPLNTCNRLSRLSPGNTHK